MVESRPRSFRPTSMSAEPDIPSSDAPDLIGASSAPVVIRKAAVRMVLDPGAAARSGARVFGRGGTAGRVVLHVERLKTTGRAGAFDVYLDAAPGAEARADPDLFVGRIAPFGPRARAGASGEGAESSFEFVLDATSAFRAASARPGFDPARIAVTLVPVHEWSSDVTVGRVSLRSR